jgi:hypothetical protein
LYVVFSLEASSWRPQACSGGCRLEPSSCSSSDGAVSHYIAIVCSSIGASSVLASEDGALLSEQLGRGLEYR